MLCWLMGLGVVAVCQAQTPVGLATVVEGDAVLVRQTTKLALKPGMRLMSGDLLQTGPTSAVVRIEFGNGAIADLGPQTQVMLQPRLASGAKRRQAPLYALSGWIKLSGFLAWITWLVVHILFLVQFQNRVMVMFQWAYSYFTRGRAARLITGEGSRLDES